MTEDKFGNRITDNTLTADNGEHLIQQALQEMRAQHGWVPADQKPLFSGVYYDSQKVGSFIVKVKNKKEETAVLKLQLKPLPFDEGSIIRHIEAEIKNNTIRLPRILADEPWDSSRGYGYLIFEDLSALPDLWFHVVTDTEDRERHKAFLQKFFSEVLPVDSWIPKPIEDLKATAKEYFQHFHEIALKSSHHHISEDEVQAIAERYFSHLERAAPENLHFTHGHMSGNDVKFNQRNSSFTLLANLYWSWRPMYYEVVFPMWVDLMHMRDRNLTLDAFLARVQSWCDIWREGVYDHDPASRKAFWLRLLERAVMTVMLDLGASEWKEEEATEKQALLHCWKEFFFWVSEKIEKLNE